MKKINILLGLAIVFICGVMGYLMYSGVRLQERRMVKWSTVESPEVAGQKIAQFMFPILNEFEQVQIEGTSDFSKSFYEGFQHRARKNHNNGEIQLVAENSHEQETIFLLKIMELDKDNFLKECRNGSRPSCVGLKTYNRFIKKTRDPGAIWISMFRLSKNKAILYYTNYQK